MNEDAASAGADPHDPGHLLIGGVLKEPQVNRFAFTRAEIAERLRHLGVAEPSFSLTLGGRASVLGAKGPNATAPAAEGARAPGGARDGTTSVEIGPPPPGQAACGGPV